MCGLLDQFEDGTTLFPKPGAQVSARQLCSEDLFERWPRIWCGFPSQQFHCPCS